MAYDERLAERIQTLVGDEIGLGQKRVFGGLCYLLNGNMAVGIVGAELMVRVGPDHWEGALALPHAREMDFTGRSMRGMVYVDEAGIAEDADLRAWLDRGFAFAGSLPPK